MIIAILVFILILGLLIFSHEFGHFILAKRAGIKVEEFGFGLPPRIFGKKIGETIYSLNLLPIGGFVKIFGEEGESRDDPRSFSSRTISQRSKIIAAGVTFNFILGTALFFFGFSTVGLPVMLGEEIPENVKGVKIQILRIAENSPAEISEIKIGDEIKGVKVPDEDFELMGISEPQQFQDLVKEYRGKEITLILGRGEKTLEVPVVPRTVFPPDQGAIGIMMAKIGIITYPLPVALWEAIKSAALTGLMIFNAIFEFFKGILISGKVIGEVRGPLGIFDLLVNALNLGFIYVLQLTIFLTITLAIINAIPFPALDGGRLLFLVIEKIRRKPMTQTIEKMTNAIGFGMLLALMAFVTFRDVIRLF